MLVGKCKNFSSVHKGQKACDITGYVSGRRKEDGNSSIYKWGVQPMNLSSVLKSFSGASELNSKVAIPLSWLRPHSVSSLAHFLLCEILRKDN
jgi:hypothetical protein